MVADALAGPVDSVNGCRPTEKMLDLEGREEEEDLREPVCKGDVVELGDAWEGDGPDSVAIRGDDGRG